FDDLLISHCFTPPGEPEFGGTSLIVFGAPDLPEAISLGAPEVRHLRILSREPEVGLGREAVSGGDLDGDGKPELVLSARGDGTEDDDPGAGRLFILYGGFPLDEDLDISDVGGSIRGSVITGAYGSPPGSPSSGDGDNFGSGGAVDFAGDVNGDGFDDLIVGAPTATRTASRVGLIYVVFGGREL